jgi:hypothetical protein
LVSGFGPNERLSGGVVCVQIMPDRLFQLARAAVNAAPDLLFRQQREE